MKLIGYGKLEPPFPNLPAIWTESLEVSGSGLSFGQSGKVVSFNNGCKLQVVMEEMKGSK